MGRLSVLECAFWGFLPLFALLHLFPLLRLFVTYSSPVGAARIRDQLSESFSSLNSVLFGENCGGVPQQRGMQARDLWCMLRWSEAHVWCICETCYKETRWSDMSCEVVGVAACVSK